MKDRFDVVIAGAGIIGLCAAWQIARRSNLRVLVVERAPSLGAGSTGASSAVCRFKYTRPETVALARDGVAAYQNWRDFIGQASPRARYNRHGVLWLGDGSKEPSRSEAERLRKLGVEAVSLDVAALRDAFPAINPCVGQASLVGEGHVCDARGEHLFEPGGGYVEPMDALADLLDAVRSRGVEVRFDTALCDVRQSGGAVVGADLARGDRVDCETIVNATGPWCAEVYAAAGVPLHWPLAPTRIQIAEIDRPAGLEGPIPVCCDLNAGIYFRLQSGGGRILVGSVRDEDERERVDNPDHLAAYADDDFVREKLFALSHRLTALGEPRRVRGYAGMYTMNLADVHPIVGKTALKGFYAANGFSGHGFKLAPAIGSLLAQAICGKATDFDTAVPPEFLAFDRDPIELAAKSVLA